MLVQKIVDGKMEFVNIGLTVNELIGELTKIVERSYHLGNEPIRIDGKRIVGIYVDENRRVSLSCS